MSSEKLWIIEQQLLLPDGKLQIAGVDTDWNIYIDGSLNGVHTSEEAICFSALARNIDEPLSVKELEECVEEERKLANEIDAIPNPIFEAPNFELAVLSALENLMHKTDSAFSNNIFLLGARETKRIALFANVAHESYGLRKIEDFFIQNSGIKELERPYKMAFERQYNSQHTELLKDKITAENGEIDKVADSGVGDIELMQSQELTPEIIGVKDPINRSRKPKLTDLDTRPVLQVENLLGRLGSKVGVFPEGKVFSLEELFPDERITIAARQKLVTGINLLLVERFIVEKIQNGRVIGFERTAKPFKQKQN